MTTINIEAAVVRQALEALENARPVGNDDDITGLKRLHISAITALRQALEAAGTEERITMTPRELAKRIAKGEKWKVSEQAEQRPVKFLANGTRFKLSFLDDYENGEPTGATYVSCFEGWEKELDGRWVALVAAEDDNHLRYTAPPADAKDDSDSDLLTIAYMNGFSNGKAQADARIAQLEAELAEQCELHGMGSDREARFMARVEQSEANYKRLVEKHNSLHISARASRDRIAELERLLLRCLPIIQTDAQMMAVLTRFAPLDAEYQAKHDSTEYESEKLLREIPAAMKEGGE